jgi:serine/threonine-protein kinase
MATGQVNLAVSPWGHVDVDGTHAGTVPPVSKLTLGEGRHTITIRNDDFAPHTVTIIVTPDQPVTIKHRFGS